MLSAVGDVRRIHGNRHTLDDTDITSRKGKTTMKTRTWLLNYIPTLMAATLILYFAFERGQSPLKTLPTLVTLCVQLLLVSANRYAFLLGGLNALVYGVAYFSEGLYFSTVSAVLISAPIQLFSFIRWGKNRRADSTTTLRRLNGKMWGAVCAAIVGGFGLCYFLLAPFFSGATYPLLDALSFTLGIVVSLLAAFRYVESQYISAVSTAISIAMWVMIAWSAPENFNYVIISVYNCFRVTQAAVRWTKNYSEQAKEVIDT